MYKIIIRSLYNRELNVAAQPKTILQHIQEAYIDWMHTCGAKGRCTTCRVVVQEGAENLAMPTVAEMRYRDKNMLLTNERLSCQAIVLGDITLVVPRDCRLPQLKYSDN